jgi:hypothetical protein
MQQRHFTLEEANALLPWLELQLTKLAPMRDGLVARQEELLALLQQSKRNGSTSKELPTVETQRAIQRLTQELQDGLREIAALGIIVQDLGRGLVDFPSYREGREVYLCWIRGEKQIAYWHETNAGFAGRQPL